MSRLATKVCVTQIGDYAILANISQTSQASVYRAERRDTGQTVAVKVLAPHLTSSPEQWQRFAQECKVASRLDHPNIVRVLDFGMDGSRAFMAMEHMAGGNLADRVDRDGALSEEVAVRWVAQVGRALHWAHQRHLIHRNVKPANILLTSEGQAKLADLGLVKDLESTDNLTQSQSILGTPHYMAPEQYEDARRVDARCDLYSLAGTLYTALCNELPFKCASAKNVLGVYRKQIANELVPPRELAPQLGERTNAAILAGLRANPDERPASVLDFLTTLGEPSSVADASKRDDTASGRREQEESSDANKRVKRRCSSGRMTSCFALARSVDKGWRGRVINISETGVCLELRRRFEPGAILTFTLGDQTQNRRSLVIRTMWVRQMGPKIWHLGCQFDQPLCDFEVQDLLEQQ